MPSVKDHNYLQRKVGDRILSHQQEAYNAVLDSRRHDETKALVKMFCGTGKSRVIFKDLCDPSFTLSIVVFPTLDLGIQFLNDYISKESGINCLNICSAEGATTDNEKISTFLSIQKKKIILVTYSSLPTLVSVLSSSNTQADVVAYDEAHRVLGEKIQSIVFGTRFAKYDVFYTATPKNENGITMKPENGLSGDCGRIVFEYSFMQAIEDGVCQDFEIMLYFRNTTHVFALDDEDDANLDDDDNTEKKLKMIANCVHETGLKRCIIYHRFSEAVNSTGTTAKKFATKANESFLKKAFKESGDKRAISLKGVTGKTKGDERTDIVGWFNDVDDPDVRIISNCKVFGEGIDTASADTAVFIDPKGSITDIIQNIGRICRRRKDDRKSVILLPIFVNKDQYEEAETAEEKDYYIRSRDNYNPILNVLSALRQEDPEYYNICLQYPRKFTPEEVKNTLKENGLSVSDKGVTLSELVGDVIEVDEDVALEEYAQRKGGVDVVSQDMGDDFIKRYGDTETPAVEMYFKQDNDMFHKVDGDFESVKTTIKPKRQPFSNRIKVSGETDIKVLWSVKKFVGEFLDGVFGIIESELFDSNEERWKKRLETVKESIRNIGKRPSGKSEDTVERKHGQWIGDQLKNRKTSQKIMKKEMIRDIWDEFASSDEFKKYFTYREDNWMSTLDLVKEYIRDNRVRPTDHSSKKNIKFLGGWLGTQLKNRKTSQRIMKNKEIRDIWDAFVLSDEFKPYFTSIAEDNWMSTLDRVTEYIRNHHTRPSQHSNDETVKSMGCWIRNQLESRKKSSKIMKNKKMRDIWDAFVTSDEFRQYFKSNEEDWLSTLNDVKEYIGDKKKRPSTESKDKAVKSMGKWISHQLANREKPQYIMKNDEIRGIWDSFVTSEEFRQYFKNQQPTRHSTPPPTPRPSPPSIIMTDCDTCDAEIEDGEVCKACTTSQRPLPMPTAPKPLEHFAQKASELSNEELQQAYAKLKFQAQSGYYPADKKNGDLHKQNANDVFKEFVKTPANDASLALILDSKNMLTTKTLSDIGFKSENIYVPQFCKEEYDIQKEVHQQVHNVSLYNFLNDSEDCKFTATWFDYQETITGNKTCRPLEDIELYFQRMFPAHNSIFAVTFCKRNVQFVDGDDTVEKSKELINDIAERYGYHLTREKIYEYGSGMYYIHWKVCENKV